MDKNSRWIYTYDYAPDSVWEPWRESEGVPDWMNAEVDNVVRRLKPDLPAWLLLADSHFTYHGTWDDTVAAMKNLEERSPISGIVHLGDLTDGLLPERDTRKITAQVISDLESISPNVYLVPGNHDYNYFRGNPDICYPDRPQYYVDIPNQGLRFIFIDSFDPKEPVRYGFTDYCTHWLESVFRMMPENYLAIVFSHLTPLVRLQAWTDNIRNREKLITVLDRYAGRILAFINGHNHCDHLFNDLKNGKFPIISVNCAKCEYFTEHKPERAMVPYRRLGDRTQESFDVMQVDGRSKEIYFTRFGAGRDRMVVNHKAAWV
ncbi:MAG: hypothetical protein HFI64_08015 [Lachnospiraceae bacterium]|nr:hypothetical protein [Lachnospiraceae bacterium]